jgi:hypothetical protein
MATPLLLAAPSATQSIWIVPNWATAVRKATTTSHAARGEGSDIGLSDARRSPTDARLG